MSTTTDGEALEILNLLQCFSADDDPPAAIMLGPLKTSQ